MTAPADQSADGILAAAARLSTGVAASGWAREAAFLSAPLVGALQAGLRQLDSRGAFRAAAIGAGAARAVRPTIRGDRLCWFGPPEGAAETEFFAAMETLRTTLNRKLGLGLFDFECHYACYQPGAVYVRHLDRSLAGAERVISVVAYLNDDWLAEDGGALRLHTPDGAIDLLPAAGALVAFESARFEHEVLPARRERLSIAAWFRRRARLPA